jgi:hypothetical protein
MPRRFSLFKIYFMNKVKLRRGALASVLLLVLVTGAEAQGLTDIGPRAPAMAAFVAVADDASAVVWNPAGLVFGPIFNLSVDLGRSTAKTAAHPLASGSAGRQQSTLVALALPPLGLSYTRISSLAVLVPASAELETPDRQDGQVLLRSVVASALGGTVLQSLGDYVTVGATVKVVRGGEGRAIGRAATWDAGFDLAERLDRRGSTRVDADLGAMVAAGRLRAGLLVRNLTEPTFDADGGGELALERHARVGAAWGDRWPGQPRTIVAADADVTRVAAVDGDRRDVAVGAERWISGARLSVRAGVRASTVGDARPVVSGGASYAVRSGTYVDGVVGVGKNEARSWGVGVRVTF